METITEYSRTQRVVLLIDLNPLLDYQDPNPYLTTLLSAAETLVSFPPLSNSLFSFKPFFSSLSPLLSSSKLSIPSLSLSFDRPDSAFQSLSSTLTSLFSQFDKTSILSTSPRARHVAASMRQLVHDYAWDSVVSDSFAAGTLSNCDCYYCSCYSVVRSNLVVLFSPILRSLNWVSDFLGVEPDDACLSDASGSKLKFCGFFENVREAFARKDIHFCWVDVNCEMGAGDDKVGNVRSETGFGFLESGIRDLGWGTCSSDSLVFGSALVPFGLIYPQIAISPKVFDSDDCCKIMHAQLSLEIQDVSGKPLECKCCDLELVNLNMSAFPKIDDTFIDPIAASRKGMKVIWEDVGDGMTNINVKVVKLYDNHVQFEGSSSYPILIREVLGKSEKDKEESSCGCIEHRVLGILQIENGRCMPRRSTPIWQILLSFLYREGYWALVSLSRGDSRYLGGILKPFTVSSALLSLTEDEFHPFGADSVICKPEIDLNLSSGLVASQSSQSVPILSYKRNALGHRKKRNKRKLNMHQEFTWGSFCKAALEQSQTVLEEVYFSRACHKSKKLNFLKCWIKQVKKFTHCSLTMAEGTMSHQDTPKEAHSRLTDSIQESEQPIASCFSVGDDSLTGTSRVQDEIAVNFQSETMEGFFSNLPHKIQQGLESEEVDLGSLAERLVNSSIYWLYQKCAPDNQGLFEHGNGSARVIGADLGKLLLREPKDLAAMYRNGNPTFQEFSDIPSEDASGKMMREYELQILFRMEILQSEVGASMEESTKEKFVKQICSLLETIQCHLEGGFFGDWSLDRYVEKIIKSRYCHSLEDVVHKIYAKMDLLLFADEEESPNPLFNSEDSNHSGREKLEKDATDENDGINLQVSGKEKSTQQAEKEHQSHKALNQEEHARKLFEAQERRKRARRFAAFTSWVPDLRRVWAPKQSKARRVKPDTLRKLSKRKEQRNASCDRVCETPMTGNKRSCNRGSSNDAKGQEDCRSIPKALFQDD